MRGCEIFSSEMASNNLLLSACSIAQATSQCLHPIHSSGRTKTVFMHFASYTLIERLVYLNTAFLLTAYLRTVDPA
jgi:hypothetical protein